MTDSKLTEIATALKAYDEAREGLKGLAGRGEINPEIPRFIATSKALKRNAPDYLRTLLAVATAAEEWYRLGKLYLQYTGSNTEADLARGRLYAAIEELTK